MCRSNRVAHPHACRIVVVDIIIRRIAAHQKYVVCILRVTDVESDFLVTVTRKCTYYIVLFVVGLLHK